MQIELSPEPWILIEPFLVVFLQEARRFQSKADALSSINQDRVSGAVSAANKAALAARVAAVKATQRATISSLSSLSFSPLAQAAGY